MPDGVTVDGVGTTSSSSLVLGVLSRPEWSDFYLPTKSRLRRLWNRPQPKVLYLHHRIFWYLPVTESAACSRQYWSNAHEDFREISGESLALRETWLRRHGWRDIAIEWHSLAHRTAQDSSLDHDLGRSTYISRRLCVAGCFHLAATPCRPSASAAWPRSPRSLPLRPTMRPAGGQSS
jgi:hypothetical protein